MDSEVPLKETLDRFEGRLAAAGKSAYTRDLQLLGEWFTITNGMTLPPERITPINMRQYRSHLLAVKNSNPAIANRKLTSLSTFCERAREAGLAPGNPVQTISLVEEGRPAPEWLDKTTQYALLRAA
jgi:site-specific recombinase XerD